MTVDTVDTEGFLEAHPELHQPTAELRLVAERLPTLTAYERAELRGRILRHLREQVEPRTRLDEMLLYPELATRLADPLVDASTNYDRLAIRHWIELIADADVNDTARLQQLFYGLDALIRVHLWKETELLLASLESRSGFPERRIRGWADHSAGRAGDRASRCILQLRRRRRRDDRQSGRGSEQPATRSPV